MKNYEEKALATELLDFIDASPSSFHAVQTISSLLEKEGYTELKESEKWNPEEGKGYFVCRNGSSRISQVHCFSSSAFPPPTAIIPASRSRTRGS